MLTIGFHAEAKAEIFNAIDYYESSRPGLGTEFLESLENALVSIRSMPMAYLEIRREIRRILLRRFPYAVIYSVRAESVHVWAVMHLKRRPGYWRRRIDEPTY